MTPQERYDNRKAANRRKKYPWRYCNGTGRPHEYRKQAELDAGFTLSKCIHCAAEMKVSHGTS